MHAYLLQIDVITQFHVLGVDTRISVTCWVWNADINFTVETTKATERRVDRVPSVGSSQYQRRLNEPSDRP